MKLEQLMEDVPFTLVQGTLETEIEDIIYDSRKAAPGLLFVCIVGTQRDSHDLAADCVAKGVNTLVIQHDIDLSAMPDVNVIKVESSRYAMAKMSANLFGNPSRQMTMIGVTGTKGKTTTTHMIKSVLEAAGRKVGMIGTNGIYYMGHHKDTANTTPESYELQKTFREFLDAGCDTALMEVSSQGLMMDRVAGVHYDVGVFTNLSPDHIGPGRHNDEAIVQRFFHHLTHRFAGHHQALHEALATAGGKAIVGCHQLVQLLLQIRGQRFHMIHQFFLFK